MTFNLRDYHKVAEAIEKENISEEDLDKILEGYNYSLVNWMDHIAQTADVKKETLVAEGPDGSRLIRHERSDGEVFQQGKPINSQNLGAMDWGILCNYLNIRKITDEMKKLTVLVSTLLGQNQNNMPYNTFYMSLGDGMKVVEGWYDEVNKKVVC